MHSPTPSDDDLAVGDKSENPEIEVVAFQAAPSWAADARARIAQFASPMADTIYMWHDKMASFSQNLHLEWSMGMRQFAQSLDDGVLSVGTLYAGSEIIHVLLKTLANHWKTVYGIDLALDFKCFEKVRSLPATACSRIPGLIFQQAARVWWGHQRPNKGGTSNKTLRMS